MRGSGAQSPSVLWSPPPSVSSSLSSAVNFVVSTVLPGCQGNSCGLSYFRLGIIHIPAPSCPSAINITSVSLLPCPEGPSPEEGPLHVLAGSPQPAEGCMVWAAERHVGVSALRADSGPGGCARTPVEAALFSEGTLVGGHALCPALSAVSRDGPLPFCLGAKKQISKLSGHLPELKKAHRKPGTLTVISLPCGSVCEACRRGLPASFTALPDSGWGFPCASLSMCTWGFLTACQARCCWTSCLGAGSGRWGVPSKEGGATAP